VFLFVTVQRCIDAPSGILIYRETTGVAFLVDNKSQVQDLPVDDAANTTRVYRLNPSPHSQLVQNLKSNSQDDISPDLSRMDGLSKYPTGKTWKPRPPGYVGGGT
jgi:hypothetical protein